LRDGNMEGGVEHGRATNLKAGTITNGPLKCRDSIAVIAVFAD
jgi:hypothetical protein